MDPLVSLAAASIALIGTHFALSHPLRAPLVRAIGDGPFLGLYSLVAAACIMWMVLAFRAAPAADLGGATGEAGWIVSTVLTLPALVLFLGSLWKNPALPNPGAAATVTREPTGVFAVTRHPMMWGFALWALSHLVLWWSWRTLIVTSAVLVLALLGARLQDRKKGALMGRGVDRVGGQDQLLAALGQAVRSGRDTLAGCDCGVAARHLASHPDWRGAGWRLAVGRLKIDR